MKLTIPRKLPTNFKDKWGLIIRFGGYSFTALWVLLPLSVLLPGGPVAPAGLLIFYFAATLMLAAIILIMLTNANKTSLDGKLVMPALLFGVISVGLLLLSSKRASIFGSNDNAATSGLTIMAALAVFYFGHRLLANRYKTGLLLSWIISLTVVGVFGLFDGSIITPIQASMLTLVPLVLYYIKELPQKEMRLIASMLIYPAALITLMLTFGYSTAHNILTLAVAAPIGWLFLSNQTKKDKVRWTVGLIISGIVVFLIWCYLLQGNPVTIVANLLNSWRSVIAELGKDIVTLAIGSSTQVQVLDGMWLNVLYRTGLAGLITYLAFIGLVLREIIRTPHSVARTISLTVVIMTTIFGFFSNVSTLSYLILWLGLGLGASTVAPTVKLKLLSKVDYKYWPIPVILSTILLIAGLLVLWEKFN